MLNEFLEVVQFGFSSSEVLAAYEKISVSSHEADRRSIGKGKVLQKAKTKRKNRYAIQIVIEKPYMYETTRIIKKENKETAQCFLGFHYANKE